MASRYQAELTRIVRHKLNAAGSGARGSVSVSNSVMELRNICNHPCIRRDAAFPPHGVPRRPDASTSPFIRIQGSFQGSGPPVGGPDVGEAAFGCSRLHPDGAEALLAVGTLPPVVRMAGKLEVLDRLLLQLHAGGHKVWLPALDAIIPETPDSA